MLLYRRKSIAIGLCTVGLSILATSAQANLVTNGSFESYTGATPKGYFTNIKPTGWSGGQNLTFLDAPGTASTNYLAVYPGFPDSSPDGGNFVEADGDPSYSGAIYQTISGLIVGQSYILTFYQAAGQQVNFSGSTTEQWNVTFGNENKSSSMFSLEEGATGAWQQQTMTFVASTTSQLLSFLAVGTPNGAPPISFLDGVDIEAVPEPASLTLISIGVLGVAAARRRRATRTNAI